VSGIVEEADSRFSAYILIKSFIPY
jgi:hypothetical protein